MSQSTSQPQQGQQNQGNQQGNQQDAAQLRSALQNVASQVNQLKSQNPDVDFSGLQNALSSAGINVG